MKLSATIVLMLISTGCVLTVGSFDRKSDKLTSNKLANNKTIATSKKVKILWPTNNVINLTGRSVHLPKLVTNKGNYYIPDFLDDLQSRHGGGEKVVYVNINSPGGAVKEEWLARVNSIKLATPGLVIKCLVPQGAGSAAVILFTMCDKRYMLSGSKLLWHSVSIPIMGRMNQYLTSKLYNRMRWLNHLAWGPFKLLIPKDGEFLMQEFYKNDTWIPAKVLDKLMPGYMTVVDQLVPLNKKENKK